MLRHRSPLFLMFCCLLAVLPSSGLGEWDEERFLMVDGIRPGMRGVGRTVFSGTRVDEFDVEILGVMKNSRPRGDIILARFSGGPLADAGVIQGMSGSPIYVDGKLIGAAAFAWPFAKQPICGITPIGEMLPIWRQMESQEAEPEDESGAPLQLLGEGAVGGANLLSDVQIPVAAAPSTLLPIKTPVMAAGFDERVVAEMIPVLESFHMNPIQAGSAAEESLEISLEPGSSLAVQLVGGDVSLSAVGTLTYREGDRIIAFGHPLFTAGGVDFPMSAAYVHSVLPSQMISFKLASISPPVGALRQDRRAGVAGIVGAPPSTVPVDLRIHESGTISPESFHFDIVDNKFLTPNLVMWTVLNALLTSGRAMGDGTMEMEARCVLVDQPDLELRNVFAGVAPYGALAAELGEIVNLLMNNNLGKISLRAMTLDISVEHRRREARIASARLDKAVVKPGEDIGVTVFLDPYRDQERIERVFIRVPDDAPEGRMVFQLTDAASSMAWEQRRAPHRFQFQDIGQLMELLRKMERNDQLVAKLVLPRSGAVVKGRELPSLPPSALAVLRGSLQGGEGGLTSEEVLAEKKVDTKLVLSGQIALPLEVKK